ncbi:hypothetical protein ACHAWU_005336 [Discostella pseudostelligera]|jgi:hypothetical protein|uniref:Uncharacterized protein n=1 Tax=Discostella pseudostelligera TaxID=259834 RepID=A0ABD3N8D9_9STRA
MIIDGKTIVITLIIVCVGSYFGLHLIRSFALSIALENHDANLAMDMTEESRRAKRERLADEAAKAAFAKVEPLLPSSVVAKKNQNQGAGSSTAATPGVDAAKSSLLPQSAPSSGNSTLSVPRGDAEAN